MPHLVRPIGIRVHGVPALLGVTALVLALFLSACPSPTENTADDPGATTAIPEVPAESTEGLPDAFDDPSAGPDRQPNEPRKVPPLVVPRIAPGTDEAAEALIADLERFVTADQLAAGVPWPDLRNPDPIAAYESASEFQGWMLRNNPTPSLAEAYTAPGSPERELDQAMFDFQNSLELRQEIANPPYSLRVEELVHPAATGITDTLLNDVPEGSVAVVYFDSIGTKDTFTVDGQYWGTTDGWTNVGPWVAIMAPTDVGWAIWWDELTEPPPPGSRDNGTPQEEDSRRDV